MFERMYYSHFLLQVRLALLTIIESMSCVALPSTFDLCALVQHHTCINHVVCVYGLHKGFQQQKLVSCHSWDIG